MNEGYTIPPNPQPKKPRGLLVPVSKELQGQAKLILKNMGASILKPKFFVIDTARMEEEDSVNQPGVGTYNYDAISPLGTPMFDTITLNGLTYEDFEGKTVTLANFRLDIALVEVSNPREIVLTKITGANGTRKEYMSDGDYVIKINGSLVNPLANTPPEALVRSLNAFCKAQKEIAVNSTVLSYLDIYSIVIVEPKFMQRVGARNVIDYELHCLSETPFELKQ